MLQAEFIHIRSSDSCVVLLIANGAAHMSGARRPSQIDGPLLRTCAAAHASAAARAALVASVSEIAPTDPRHDAAYAAAAELKSGWERDIDQACHRPACTVAGLVAKARLAVSLLDRGEDGAVIGGPAMRVAASLADDLLVLESADT